MPDVARIRRLPGGGHFLYGLSHAQLGVLVLFVVVVVAIVLYYRRQ